MAAVMDPAQRLAELRRRAEETLRQREEQFRKIFETTTDGIFVFSPTKKLVDANPAVCALHGYRREQMLRMDPREFLHPDSRPVLEAFFETIASGKEFHAEARGVRSDGTTFDAELYGVPYRIRGELHFFATVHDITERKQAEETLRKERDRAQQYLDIAGVILVVIDRDQTVSLINRKGIEILGHAEAEVLGRNWFDCFLPERIRHEVKTAFEEMLNGNVEPIEYYENPVLTEAGEERVIAWHNTVLRDERGRIIATLSSGRDITERRQAESALQETQERFRDFFENAPIGFHIFGPDRTIIDINDAELDLIGYTRSEIVNKKTWADLIVPEQRAGFEKHWQDITTKGRVSDLEYTLLHKDGHHVHVILNASARFDADGELLNTRGSVLDITERRRAEAERRRLEAQVQHAQKLESLGVLAGGIAHDFNNLLAGILGFADLALRDLAAGSPARGALEKVIHGAQQAADLTKQMLAYSGRGTFVVAPLDLSRLIEEMAHLLKASVSKKAILRYRLADDLPAVEADAAQLRQVLMNLVTNASEAIGDAGGVIAITTGTMECDRAYLRGTYLGEGLPEATYAYLEVSDTGSGMDEATLASIFDPFFTTKFTGRGLGMAATLGIVRSHHGTIHVDSKPGRGTTLRILFPVSEQQAEQRGPAVEAEWRGQGTVLVIDDEETVRTVARAMLERMGFAVLTATDGREGVELFRQHADEVAAVVLDMSMPHMNGTDVVRELRRIRSDVRILLSSGYSEQEAVGRFAQGGLAGFVQKPYRLAELRAKMCEALSG